MMKKILLMIFLVLAIAPLGVVAQQVDMVCSTTVQPGGKVTCEAEFNPPQDLVSLDTVLNVPSQIDLSGFSASSITNLPSNFVANYGSNTRAISLVDLQTGQGQSNVVTLMIFEVDVSSQATGKFRISLDSLDAYDQQFAKISLTSTTAQSNEITVASPGGSCVDLDGDGYGQGCAKGVDCDDNDPNKFQFVGLLTDRDGDGYPDGAAFNQCVGATAPQGTLFDSTNTNPLDCNDNDANVNVCAAGTTCQNKQCIASANACTDADGDGYVNQVVGSSCTPLANQKGYEDCDDADASKWEEKPLVPDQDNDGYYDSSARAQGICSGNTFPPNLIYQRTSKGPDCNDADPSINPGETDLAGDGIDQNCDGVDGPTQNRLVMNDARTVDLLKNCVELALSSYPGVYDDKIVDVAACFSSGDGFDLLTKGATIVPGVEYDTTLTDATFVPFLTCVGNGLESQNNFLTRSLSVVKCVQQYQTELETN